MKTVSYQEYARELEMAKKRLEEKTCVQGISRRAGGGLSYEKV